jgi:hypothetical protein
MPWPKDKKGPIPVESFDDPRPYSLEELKKKYGDEFVNKLLERAKETKERLSNG